MTASKPLQILDGVENFIEVHGDRRWVHFGMGVLL